MGAWGYAGARTRALDGLAARGARFANAEAAVPLTGPSHATIFTGSYPPVHGVRDNVTFTLDARHATLASLLKAAGYQTAAFVGAYPVAAAFGLGRGFDEYHEGFHQIPIPGQGAERPGNEVADDVIAWLKSSHTAPFFVWAHFYDPHAPYTPPSPYREEFKDRPYDGEIAFADAQLGRILDALDATGHRDDTVIVAMSDHGESLGEHDERTHAILIYEATLHVPLLMAGRRRAPRPGGHRARGRRRRPAHGPRPAGRARTRGTGGPGPAGGLEGAPSRRAPLLGKPLRSAQLSLVRAAGLDHGRVEAGPGRRDRALQPRGGPARDPRHGRLWRRSAWRG